MGKLVISVAPNGDVETLRDKNFDIGFLGNKKVERITEVLFDEDAQGYFIEWRLGPWAGKEHTYAHDYIATGIPDRGPLEEVVGFTTYEEAVEREILCVNLLRLQGITFT